MDITMVLSLSMFFGGAVGSLCVLYLRRISSTLDAQALIVADIDKRVVRAETRLAGLNK